MPGPAELPEADVARVFDAVRDDATDYSPDEEYCYHCSGDYLWIFILHLKHPGAEY